MTILFDNRQARFIRKRKWHETQSIEELPDGGLILHFETSRLGEVQLWVMQYGSHAEVLEPLELREEVKQDILDSGKKYRKNASHNNLHGALSYYEQALTISREIGDCRSEGIILGSLGGAYIT